MSVRALLVKINNKEAALRYNTDTWKLTLIFLDSAKPELEIDMSDIKKIYVSSVYKDTYYKDKNQLARTVIGGVLLGPTGAIIGAVSGAGTKEVTDGTYGVIHIETADKEFIVICKENVLNSSVLFIRTLNELIASGDYKTFKKERRKFAKKWLLILAALILFNILLWTLISFLE